MACAHYYVVLHHGQWKISFEGKHFGPYDTQKSAIRAAVDAAHKNRDSQVIVQGLNNQWRTEWTYGHDPYPPAG